MFQEAINFTSAKTGFRPRMIEKDYFCSVILEYIAAVNSKLVFKGGTCLSKIHTDFYRLSEDLDFSISISPSVNRTSRSKCMESIKKNFNSMDEEITNIETEANLAGHNESTQYIGLWKYYSLLRDQPERVKIEIGLREKVLEAATPLSAGTLLKNPLDGENLVETFKIGCLSYREAMAEKIRAALTRREPAIRDFFDIDYSVRKNQLNFDDKRLLFLIEKKLNVPGTGDINLSKNRINKLRRQLKAQLEPVLRPQDFQRFDFERALKTVKKIAAHFK